jgi:Inner membrane protein CreD
MKRYLALGVVWVGCTVAWMLLGATLLVRSGEMSSQLVEEVHQLWGPPLDQSAPVGSYLEQRTREERTTLRDGSGRPYESVVQRTEDVTFPLPLVSTRARAVLALEHRQKGLLWFPTYAVEFEGHYALANDTTKARTARLSFPLPARSAIYDGFEVLGADGTAVKTTIEGGAAHWSVPLAPGAQHAFFVRYRTRGTSSWTYRPTAAGGDVVRDFRLDLVSSARGIDFAPGSISPSEARASGGGWQGSWQFKSLVASAPISLELPQKTNPGPLAARITFFAPVALLFYFFVVGLLSEGRGLRLHPLSWFLIGCAFFADHLLFAYLADHVPLGAALALSSGVSVVLVVSYAQWLVGWQFAVREMGVAQLIYLVGFSLTFLLKGFTGLSITIGAVLTLFLMMQITGKRLQSQVPRAELVEA